MFRNEDVEAWFAEYENPMKPILLRIRDVILGADPRIEECIKWQVPTFTFDGNLASVVPMTKQHARLIFHTGALIPGIHPRLRGTSGTGRVLELASLAEVDQARRDVERIAQAWCAWRVDQKAGRERAALERRQRSQAARRP
jgi:hypothetical protein